MQIRPYRADDVPELAEIFTMAVHLLGRKHYDEAQLAAWAPLPPDLEAWTQRFSSLQTRVLEDAAGCPLGFVSWRQDSKDSGYISLIFVRPDAARKGIASQLLATAEAALADAEQLHVHASLIARPFFERHGYRVVSEETAVRAGIELTRFEMHKLRTPIQGTVTPA